MQNFATRLLSPLVTFIDRTTMYKMLLYALSGLVFSSILLGFFGLVYPSPLSQVSSLLLAVGLALCLSYGLALIRGVLANHESSIITGLILFFLVNPAESLSECVPMIVAVTVAMVSKYVFVYRRQHLVNAAAMGVFVLWLSGYGAASWWIATPFMFAPLIIAGVLVISKVRKWILVAAFLGSGFLVFLFEEWRVDSNLGETWWLFFLSYPALFLGFFMLTEPFSMPPTKKLQAWYGVLVGVLSNTSFVPSFMSMTPELALVVGNLVFYPSTLRRKLVLTLESKQVIATTMWEFIFTKPAHICFKAGQYLEWMLPHKNADSRGIRRYFTIASSPTEPKLRVMVKIPTPGSSYKTKLQSLKVGEQIICSQLAGDFVLPKNPLQKIGMVAGGVGVTPFRSMITYITDMKYPSDVVLYYGANTWAEVAYMPEFAQASELMPLRLILVLAKETKLDCEEGYVNAAMIMRQSPDYKERVWYVSGPPGMVAGATSMLRSLGIPSRHIMQDFFPGLA